MRTDDVERRVSGWCALCRSRCGCISVVRDGRLVAVERNPDHPTGPRALREGTVRPRPRLQPRSVAASSQAHPAQGDPDPGWVRIGWDEALDLAASKLLRIAEEDGPEGVAFAITTPSGTSISDSLPWLERLMRAFGSPNNVYGTEICNWHKDHATRYTFGAGIGTPDLDSAGCVLLWGHNPTGAWLAQGQRVNEAKARGARLVVVDPRRAGLAAKADEWLRVRPGTDGALALGIAGVMIEEGWFDRGFLEDWSNGPFLVVDEEGSAGSRARIGGLPRGRLLAASDLAAGGDPDHPVAWRAGEGTPEAVDPGAPAGPGPDPGARWALEGSFRVRTAAGEVACRTAFLPLPRPSAGSIRRSGSNASPGFRPARCARPRASSGSHARSPTTRGPGSGSTPTRPRPTGRSRSCTRSPGAAAGGAATWNSQPSRRATCPARSSRRPPRPPSASASAPSARPGAAGAPPGTSTGRSSSASPTRCGASSPSARTCSSRTPQPRAAPRPSGASTSTYTPTST